MRQLSPFMRRRLASQQKPPGDHPDANLLLAFAERSLTRRERAATLAHLAGCPECREVVALNSIGPETPRRALSARTLAWWALPATAVLVGVIAIVPRNQRTPSSKSPVIASPPSSSPAAIVPKEVASRPVTPQIRTGAKKNAALPRNELAGAEPSPAPLPPALSLPSLDQSEVQPPPPEPALAVARSIIVTPPLPSDQLVVPKSMFSAAGRAGAAQKALWAQPINERTVWSLEESPKPGAVRKSDDGGKTWRTVSLDQATRFYSLSASGSNIWVGGEDGKLFHSLDDGVRWQEISVQTGEQNGAIVGLDAHGDRVTLKTNSGATWTTEDAGAHWRRE